MMECISFVVSSSLFSLNGDLVGCLDAAGTELQSVDSLYDSADKNLAMDQIEFKPMHVFIWNMQLFHAAVSGSLSESPCV